MCGKNSTTTSTSSPNPTAMAAYGSVLDQAQNVAQTPYQYYPGQMVAPLNSQEALAGSNINANANYAQPYINMAAGYAQNAAQPITGQQIQNYLDPFTNSVVGATEASLNQQNAIQQSQLTGNAASENALGGNRVGLAQAALAGQQQLSEAPTIAGLYSQGYGQALQEANTEQQAQAQAAYSLGNLGVAGQNAALTGAGAELGYGQLGQQTSQAADTAAYNQWLAGQAYPFQTLGWEASLATGVGSQMGGTNVTQGPTPNPLAQYGGLALAGLALVKDGGRVTGRDHGGRIANCGRPAPVAGFAMGGTPYSSLDDGGASYIPSIQITPGNTMPKGGSSGTQQQQQTNPLQQANQILGLNKTLSNLGGGSGGDVSTFGAQVAGLESGLSPEEVGLGDLGAFRRGGRIPGFAGGGSPMPEFADGGGPDDDSAPQTPSFDYSPWSPYNPASLSGGQTAGLAPPPQPAPAAPAAAAPVAPSYDAVTAAPASQTFTGNLGGNNETGTAAVQASRPNPFLASPVVTSGGDLSPGRGMPSMDAAAHAIGTVESGGSKNPYSEIGPPMRNGDRALGRWQVMQSNLPSFLRQAGLPQMTPQQFLGDPQAQRQVFNTVFGGYMQKYGDFNDAASAWFSGRPMRAAGNSSDGYMTVPQYIAAANRALTGGGGGQSQMAGMGSSAMAFAPERGGQASAAPEGQQDSGFGGLFGNPMHLSSGARQALLAAGLGMAASRSPYLGNAIGEGGLAGLQAFNAQHKESFNEDLALKKLDQAAKQAQQHLDIQNKQLQQGQERLDQGKFQLMPGMGQGPNGEQVAGSYKFNTKTGEQEFVPGVTLSQKGKTGDATAFSDKTIDLMADAIRKGNTQVLQNLGAGAMKSENVAKVWNRVAEMVTAEGGTGGDLAAARANFNAQLGAAKSQAVREANVAANIAEAQKTFPLAIEASDKLPRSQFVPWNRVVQMVQSGTSSPELAQFHTAVQGVITAYSQAMARAGVATVDGRHAAEGLLNTAQGPEAFKAVLGQMSKEMEAARAAPDQVRQEILSRISGRPAPTGGAPGPAGAAPAGGGSDPLAEARAAISRGAPRDAVIQRLRQNGIDPTGL